MLKVNLFGIEFQNPVWAASGTFGFGLEYAEYTDINRIGAICTKGLSLKPREGNEPPRIWETPCGILNSIGLQNPGVDYFKSGILPKLRKYRTRVIANIYGSTEDEYLSVVEKLNGTDGVHAIEVNVSCPNVKKGGMAFGSDKYMVSKLTRAIKEISDKPVIVKLSPNVTNIVEIAKAAESAGADGITAINTLLGMAIDIRKRKPRLKNVFGGLSGPAIKPIALRMVYEIAQAVKIPVIGVGGITDYEDAVEFFLAGARAVEIGTANFVNPNACIDISSGIKKYLKENGYKHINEIISKLSV